MNKSYAIVIPTYSGHKEQVTLFLKSYEKLCSDKHTHKIFLIVSSHEETEFIQLADSFPKEMQLEVVTLKKIIKKLEKKNIQEEKLLTEVGKFNFQAIKKMYGALYTGADVNLILDSEALAIRKIKFEKIFSNYIQKPFVFYSPYFANEMQQDVTYLSCDILDKPHLNKWFLETQYWFFEKKTLKSLQKYVEKKTKKSLLENFIEVQPLFPEIFYFVYLYYFERSRVKFVNAEQLVKDTLGPKNYLEYRSRMVENTSFEYLSWGISKNTWQGFQKILQKYKIAFFKYDDRWQIPDNTAAQQSLIKETPSILLLPCRVVTKEFKVDTQVVPQNHDPHSNEPILSTRSVLSLVRRTVIGLEVVKQLHQRYMGWKENNFVQNTFTKISPLLDEQGTINLQSKKSKVLKIQEKLAFDVGAFTGNSIKRLKSLGYERIVCFEPSRRNFVHLYEGNKNDDSISYVHRAVSNKNNEVVTFYSNQFLPWLNTLHTDWLDETRHAADVKNISTTQIKTITLDAVIEEIGEIPGYIKIDTEGHELSSLQGLHYKPQLLSFEWISERKESLLDCLLACKKLGFTKFYVELREATPEFENEKALSYDEARKYSSFICKNDLKNNLGGNVWCT